MEEVHKGQKFFRGPLTIIERLLNMDEARARYFSKPTPIDLFLERTVLQFIPESVTPNQITLFRFVCIPVVLVLLFAGYNLAGLILFVIAALSDMIDGALARTRQHITSWGILADPFADKLLIGFVSILLVTVYISVYLALTIVLIELTLIFSAYYRYKGKVVPAKLVGKVKMVLQSFGLGFLLLFMVVGSPVLLSIATYVLCAAILFALLSLFVYRSI